MFAQLRLPRRSFLLPLVAISFSIASCQPQSTTQAPTGTGESPAASPAAAGGNNGANVSLTGAGASFPAPLYLRWFAEYNKQNPNVRVSYQSVGSGAGVEQFTQGTVDFGASDTAMKPEEIAKVQRGAVLLPMTAGAVVVAYNLPNVEASLKLPRAVYSDIFLGNIKSWNDPRIAKANPGVNLPNSPITVVHRSDGSGTTSVFTQHLSAINPQWKSKVGSGKTVDWPTGVGAKGNEGITAQIQQTQGAIGYVEYGYAAQNQLATATLENKAGNYVAPSPESAAQTLAAVQLPANLVAFITDPEGKGSYPIVTYTWIMAYDNYQDKNKAQALENVVKWALTDGQQYTQELGYVPLPKEVVNKVQAQAEKITS
jgi:phosphate transport system substrate-binding protein